MGLVAAAVSVVGDHQRHLRPRARRVPCTDVSDIPIASANLAAVRLRQPDNYQQQAGTFQTTIAVSVGPRSPASASTSFASNHGQNLVTVFTGGLSLPATTSSAWPAPWQVPIPFASPVPYSNTAGQSLVIEFQTTGSSNQRSWSLEGYRAEVGNSMTELYQSGCTHSGGTASGGWGWSSQGLVPGGTFQLNLSGYPLNNPSLAANGLFFGVAGQGSPIGGLITPFPVTALGLPSPAGCQWAIDISGGSYPMAYRQTTGTNPSAYLQMSGVPIANSPSLAGISFYTQNLALDLVSGSPSLFPSIAIRWYIGPGTPILASRVLSLSSSIQPSGSVAQSTAASLAFLVPTSSVAAACGFARISARSCGPRRGRSVH